MKEFIPNIITGVCTLIGALGGVYWTQKGNKNILEQQVTRDKIKEKRNDLIETLEIYSRVLKADGENVIIIKDGGPFLDFDLDAYQNEIRPILYEKYYLLNDDVAKIIAGMDGCIKKCNYNHGMEREDHDYFNRNYYQLINNIRQHVYNFRQRDMN
ncbi:hypothetical protein V8T57_001137 [Bacillus wiedmannii]